MNAVRVAALVAIIFALVMSIWRPSDTGGLIAGLEGRALDARFLFRGHIEPPDNVAILAIDDRTLAALDAFPPPRDTLANALEVARSKGAKVIAFDLLLSGEGKGDQALTNALAKKDDSVLAISLSNSAVGSPPTLQSPISRSSLSLVIGAPSVEPPLRLAPKEDFAAHASLGHVNITREVDGSLRRILLANQAGNDLVLPALPLEAVRQYRDLPRSDISLDWGKAIRIGGDEVTANRFNEAGLNYYGPRGTIRTYSLIDAKTAPLAGRMVFVGATAEGFGDTFPSPFDRNMPGVEALATMAANITTGGNLRRDDLTWLFDILLMFVAVIACVWAASRESPFSALLLTIIAWTSALTVLQVGFMRALWLDGAALSLSMIFATFCGGAARWLLHQKSASNLAQYQSPALAQVLADKTHPVFDGRAQKAAALFVDAADFTARTERLGPARTTRFLKKFHGCVERAASANGGVVEQYAGDGAMICFGLPEPKPEDAVNAMNCAESLFSEIQSLSEAEILSGEKAVSIRIGVHYGDVSAAVLGSANHNHVTFVGDVINAASRLQDVAKELEAELVVSDDLIRACGDMPDQKLVFHGPANLRGRDKPLDVWLRSRKI